MVANSESNTLKQQFLQIGYLPKRKKCSWQGYYMELDLDIRSKKILIAYPLPTCTQWSIFLLLDQG